MENNETSVFNHNKKYHIVKLKGIFERFLIYFCIPYMGMNHEYNFMFVTTEKQRSAVD